MRAQQDATSGELVYGTRFTSFEAAATSTLILGIAGYVSYRLYRWLRRVKSPSIRWAPVLFSLAVFVVASFVGVLTVGAVMDRRAEIRFSPDMQEVTVVQSNVVRTLGRSAFARSDVEAIGYAGRAAGNGTMGFFLQGDREREGTR
jgi:hypothetical protein